MSWIPENADIVHLGGTQPHCVVQRRGIGVLGRRLFRVVGENTGTEAYIISKACAAQLHRDFVAIDREFDQILFNGGSPHLSIYKMLPALAIQDYALDTPRFTGLIERASMAAGGQKLTGVQKIRRETGRISRQAASVLGISPLRRMRVRFR